MDKYKIEILYQRYLDNTCTDEERRELNDLLANVKLDKTIKDVLYDSYYNLVEEELMGMKVDRTEEIFNYILSQPQKQKVKRSLWPRIAAAASILAVLGTGFYFYRTYKTSLDLLTNLNVKNDIPAGQNGATLTLANGRIIKLSDAVKGRLAEESGVSITKTKDGQLVYTVRDAGSGRNDLIAYNTLSTAKGEQYQVVLPDFTKVWLNAASSLKYPATFANLKERKVILTGEAYFEVTHNARQPFKVQAAGQLIEDIGTAFNVNSYADEPDIKTTLIEGSIRLNEDRILKPGEQGINHKGTILVKNADLSQAIAWKNGDFIFKNEDFKTIMRQLARWYNIDVIYEDSAPDDVQLVGYMSRSKNLSSILNIMEITGKVHFKLEGRRIIVTK